MKNTNTIFTGIKHLLLLLLIFCLTQYSAAQNNIRLSPVVQPAMGHNAQVGSNLNISGTLGQPVYGTLQNGNVAVTQGFQQPEMPLPPVAPESQTVCSDTAYTFTFANVMAGANADQVEWSLHSNFDTSYIINSGDTIQVTVASGEVETVWLRSRVGVNGRVSSVVIMTLTNGNKPGELTAPASQTICGDTANNFILDSLYAGFGADWIEWSKSWSFANSGIINSGGDLHISVNSGTIDTIWLRSKISNTGCVSDSISFTSLKVNALPDGKVSPMDSSVSIGQSVRLLATGGYSYLWIDSGNTNDNLLVTPATGIQDYTVVVTDSLGCSDTVSSVIRLNTNALDSTATIVGAYFEKNLGQFDEEIKFRTAVAGTHLRFMNDRINLYKYSGDFAEEDTVHMCVWDLVIDSINPTASIKEIGIKPPKLNYFIGNDSSKWHYNVPVYAAIEYQNIYDGISMKYYRTKNQQLEYDIEVDAYADIADVRLKFQGIQSLNVDSTGQLIVETALGTYSEKKPYAYQIINDQEVEVDVNYTLLSDTAYSFAVSGGFDSSKALIIDPIAVVWSTFTGTPNGNSEFYTHSIDVDGSGVTYGGEVWELDFFAPNVHGFYTYLPHDDFPNEPVEVAFVSKINTTGTDLIYWTFFGGSNRDKLVSLKLANSGVYTTGITTSADFPTLSQFTGSPIVNLKGENEDVFFGYFDSNGYPLYLNQLGGTQKDIPSGIAVDDGNTAYIAGTTASSDFLTSGPTTLNQQRVFLLEINPLNCPLGYNFFDVYGGLGSVAVARDIIFKNDVFICGDLAGTSDFPIGTITAGTFPNNGFILRVKSDHTATSAVIGGNDLTRILRLGANNNRLYFLGETRSNDLLDNYSSTSPSRSARGITNFDGFLGYIDLPDFDAVSQLTYVDFSSIVTWQPLNVSNKALGGIAFNNNNDVLVLGLNFVNNVDPVPTACALNYIGALRMLKLDADLQELKLSFNLSGQYDVTKPIFFDENIYYAQTAHAQAYTTPNAYIRNHPNGLGGDGLLSDASTITKLEDVSGYKPNAGPDKHICTPDQTSVQIGGNPTFDLTNDALLIEWKSLDPADPTSSSIDDIGASNPIVHPTVTTTYQVTLSSSDGYFDPCIIGTDEVTVFVKGCCEGDDYSGNELTFENISSSDLTAYFPSNVMYLPNHEIVFKGTLTIDNDFIFVGCPNIKMGSGAKIVIENGASLSILSSHIYACSDMWVGIDVAGGPDPGELLITNFSNTKSEINDALYAVHLHGKCLFSSQNTIYRNNFIGIFFAAPEPSSPFEPGPGITMNRSFFGNVFEGTRTLKTAYPTILYDIALNGMGQQPYENIAWSWAGIETIFLGNLIVGSNGGATNYFHQLANGIVNIAGHLTVINSRFDEIQPYDYNFGFGGIRYQGNGILALNFNIKSHNNNLTVAGRGKTTTPFTFNNCRNGIVAYGKSNVNIANNNMFCEPQYSASAIRIMNCVNQKINVSNNTINYGSRGIQFLNNDPVYSLTCNNNDITIAERSVSLSAIGLEVQGNPYRPVRVANYTYNNIWANSYVFAAAFFQNSSGFSARNNNIYLTQPTQNLLGMFYANCRNFTDKYNYVNSTLSSAIVTQHPQQSLCPIGIAYASCIGDPTIPVYHYCNTMENIYTGMYFFGPNSVNVNISANKFNPVAATDDGVVRMHDGLVIDEFADIPQQDHAGNQWFGNDEESLQVDLTYSGKRAVHRNTMNAPQEKFLVQHSQGSSYYPFSFELNPSLDWFLPTTTTDLTCTTSTPPHPCSTCGGISGLDFNTINGLLSYSNFGNELKWMNEAAVYRKLKYNPALLDSSTTADSFYMARQNSTMGKLVLIDSLYRGYIQPDSATMDLWDIRNAISDSLLVLIIETDSARADTSIKESDRINLTNQITGYSQFIDSLQILTDSDMIVYNNARDTGIVQANLVNNGIVDSNAIETNHKAVNNILFNWAVTDSTIFDSIQLDQLFTIAFECPLLGGNAVYEARSLLSLVVDTTYIDADICDISSKTDNSNLQQPAAYKVDTVASKIKVVLYPNPAQDYVIIKADRELMEPILLNVMNVMGQTAIQQNINIAGGFYKLDTSPLNSGIYFVNLYQRNEKIFGGKLSILVK